MDEFTGPGAGCKPDPAGRREQERAVLGLTDAAQAATRAAILLERGELAESRRLTRLARPLYASADAFYRVPERAEHQRPP